MDVSHICRVCLASKEETINIFSQSDYLDMSFSDIIQQISSLNVDFNDQLSKNICLSCKDFCNDYLKFREMIINSNEYQNSLIVKEEISEYELETMKIETVDGSEIQFLEINEEHLTEDDTNISAANSDICNDTEYVIGDEIIDTEDDDFVEMASTDDLEIKQSPKRKSSSKTRLHSCDVCKRKFTTADLLTRHEVIHSNLITQIREEDKMHCIICQKKFDDVTEKEEHMRDHKLSMESEAISCQYCNKSYNKFNSFIRHLKTHEENKTHECNVCKRTFALGQDLIDHLNGHKGYKPHKCHICNKSYLQITKLKVHLKTHSTDRDLLCTQCGKSFTRHSNLRQHLLRHSGEKKFHCTQCPAKFVSKGNLKAHMSAHTNTKPYKCETCGSSFTQPYSLVKHNRIHSGERPFVCEFCDMRFYSSDHLKRHIRTHTGEKPYKCEFCPKAFAQNGDLNKHKRTHIGKNTYKCSEAGCPEAFRLLAELRDHMKVHYCKEFNFAETETEMLNDVDCSKDE